LVDHDFKAILQAINETAGIKIFGYINNGFGPQSVYWMKDLCEKDCFKEAKKLILKDTYYVSNNQNKSLFVGSEKYMQPSAWFNYLSSNTIKFEALTTLVLSKVSILTK
jgi:hypothetical protein